MYSSVYYDKKASRIYWSEYDQKNIRNEYNQKWVPDFYVETKDESEFHSQSGKNLKRVQESTFAKRKNKIKLYKEEYGLSVYGSDLSPENKFILERWPGDINTSPQIRVAFIDIEAESENGFPDQEQAKERINVLTIYSNQDNIFHTWCLENDYVTTDKQVEAKTFQTEEEMLEDIVNYINKTRHEIWTGWNLGGFDIPYLYNRILRILDHVDVNEYNKLLNLVRITNDDTLRAQHRKELKDLLMDVTWVHKLSPFGVTEKRTKMVKDKFTKEMKPKMCYVIEGVTDCDYLMLDEQFRMGKRDSYKLDDVAEDELGERKLEYDGTIREFYLNDWNRFVDYNIQDVRLIVNLDRKLGYISQAISLSYKCHCQFKDNVGTVQKVETAIYNFLMKENIVMDDRKGKPVESRIPGAHVTQAEDLRRGIHRWVIDVDVASLYPSLMRGLNISYDTKIATIKGTKHVMDSEDNDVVAIIREGKEPIKSTAKEVKQLIKEKGYNITSNNVITENLEVKKGILVKMLDMWYGQRKADKKRNAEHREKALEIFNNAVEVSSGHKVEEKGKIKLLSDVDFETYNEEMRLAGIFFNLQWSCKILLNSVYGCLASGFFRFHDKDLAASVTLSGQTIIKNNGKMINDYFNKEIFEHKVVKRNFTVEKNTENPDVLVYQDTDSSFLTFDHLMDKLNVPNDDASRMKVTKFLAKIAMTQLEKFAEEFFPKRFNAKNTIFWDQELIAKTAIWCQPKKYICYVVEAEGKPPKDPLLRKGLDIVRSSIPRKFKKEIEKVVKMILMEERKEEDIQLFIANLYKEFKTWKTSEIAIPVSCNNLAKWYSPGINFQSGCPQHMKAAIAFNYYLKMLKLKDYIPLRERDKFKMIFLSKNNIYPLETMGYNDKLPPEMEIEQFIDKDRHFERGFIMPLTQIFDAIGWKFPEVQKNSVVDISSFFE